jgi:aminopeptidase N
LSLARKNMKKTFIAASIALMLAQLHGHAMAAPAARAENAYLSQQDAAARSARVANVDYTLDFTLTGAERFSGSTTLQFDLNDASAPLTIDLDKATITASPSTARPSRRSTTSGSSRWPPPIWWLAATPSPSPTAPAQHQWRRPAPHGRPGRWPRLHLLALRAGGCAPDVPGVRPADLKGTYQVTVSTPADWVVSSTTREPACRKSMAASAGPSRARRN